MTAYDKTFDDIRPFTDQEAIAALPKAIRIPYLEQVIRYGLPDLTPEQQIDRFVHLRARFY